jgi:ParB-like chromosome segregation protein Spo0J
MDGLVVDRMSAASPDLSSADLTALQDSIATLGQLVPIVVYRGKVIDGRKRLAVCRALGVEPYILVISDDATATEYAAALNLLRTHYSAGQRAMYGAALATLARGHRPPVDKSTGGKTRAKTAAEAADLTGSTRDNVQAAKAVHHHGAPELIEAVQRGDVSLGTAVTIAKTVPKGEHAALTARLVKAKGTARKVPAGTFRAVPSYKRLPQRPTAVVIEKALAQALTSAEVLHDYGTKILPNGETSKAWIKTVDKITTLLRRFRRRLNQEDGHEG